MNLVFVVLLVMIHVYCYVCLMKKLLVVGIARWRCDK